MKLHLAAILLTVASSNATNLRSTNKAKRSLTSYDFHEHFIAARDACALMQMSTMMSSDKTEIKDASIIHGEVCVGYAGELKMDDDSSVNGQVIHEGMVEYDPDEETIATSLSTGVVEGSLEDWKTGVSETSTALVGLCATTEKDYNPEDGAVITVDGLTVMCFTGDVKFKDGDFTIEGDGTLIMNIEKKLHFDKATVKAAGGMSSENIIFNVVGDDEVKLVGECKDGVCTTEVDGTILAADKIEIDESILNGWAFSRGEIVVKHDAVVVSDPTRISPEVTPAPSPEPTEVTPSPTHEATSEFWQKETAPPSSELELCPNSLSELGITACSVLQASSEMESGSLEIRDDFTAVYGDVCVGTQGKLKMDDGDDIDEFIFGAARLQAGAILYTDLDDVERRTHYLVEQDDSSITSKTVDAATKSIEFEAKCLGTDINILSEWKSETPTIQVDGETVICVDGDVEFKNGLFTVTGTGTLIMNIAKKLVIDDATIEASDSKVLFNMMSMHNDDVQVKAASVVDGTILGMNRKIEVIESRINGQIISAEDIKVKYGALVVCNNDEVPVDDGFPERTASPIPSPEETTPETEETPEDNTDTASTTDEIDIVEETPTVCHHTGAWVEEAAFCTVFQMSDSAENGKLEVSGGDTGAINGNACVGTKGELKISDKHEISNTVYLGEDVKYDFMAIQARIGALEIPQDTSLADARLAASVASATLESKCTGDVMKDWEPESMTITVSGETVLCIEENVEFKGGEFAIAGEGSLIVNIGKKLKLDGATVKVDGNMKSTDVIFNVFGDDGVQISDAELDGTILSPHGKIELDSSYVNGQILSIKDILIKNDSLVSC